MSDRLPTLTARQVVATLKRGGFIERYQRGSHLFLFNPETDHESTVAIHPGDLKRPTLKGIIKQAGLTEEEFRELL